MHVRGGMNKRLQAIHPAHDMTPEQIRELLLTRDSVYIGNRDTIIADIYLAPAHGIKYSTIERLIKTYGYVIVMSNNSDQRYRLDAKSGLSEPEFRNLISWMTNPWICISTPPKIVDMFTEAR